MLIRFTIGELRRILSQPLIAVAPDSEELKFNLVIGRIQPEVINEPTNLHDPDNKRSADSTT